MHECAQHDSSANIEHATLTDHTQKQYAGACMEKFVAQLNAAVRRCRRSWGSPLAVQEDTTEIWQQPRTPQENNPWTKMMK
jgi:hypothetical protein